MKIRSCASILTAAEGEQFEQETISSRLWIYFLWKKKKNKKKKKKKKRLFAER